MKTVTPVILSELKPVAELDPAGHRHHDVLAAVLDMFTQMSDVKGDRWLLAHCVAAQLLNCRCKEGKAVRNAIRVATVGVHAGRVPVSLVGGRCVMETRGKRYQWCRKADIAGTPRALLRRHKGLYYRRSTLFVAVSADVVLTLAGLSTLLPAIIRPDGSGN